MIGVSSLCMLHSGLEEFLETVDNTFSHVEIICEGAHTNLELLDSYNYTVSLHAPFSDLNTASLNKAILKESIAQVSDCIEQANTYNAEAVCIHPAHYSPLSIHFKERALKTHIQSLKTLAKKAEECNVLLGIENMPYFPILCAKTPEEIKTILEQVDSDYLRFTFDIGHANITGDVSQFLSLKDAVLTVHVHDNTGDQDSHLALGKGTIPLDIITQLKDALLVIEVYTYEDALTSLDILKTIL